MKQFQFRLSFIALLFFLAAGIATGLPHAYAFSSGSTGIVGQDDFTPTTNIELTIPEGGVFNFGAVVIPSGVTVTFRKDSKNSPIIILASGDVTISGTINVNGANGTSVAPGAGGPGGYNGGIGGVISQAGRRGEGIGGGGYGLGSGCNNYGSGGGGGGYFTAGNGGGANTNCVAPGSGGPAFGNERILPLIGGSGGGGGGGTANNTGTAGGGGGGAVLIASSGSLTMATGGSIAANGGAGASCYSSGCGGGGSGGSIRLIANYILGSGSLSAAGGGGGTGAYGNYGNAGNGSNGRIRLEAITVSTTLSVNPNPASIVQNIPDNYAIFPADIPSLTIASVAGIQVPDHPTGLIGAPDVSIPFNASNPVTVVVNGKNVAVDTVVTVKATPSSGLVTSATGTLTGTINSSSASVPISISTSYPSVLTASVTLVVTALNGGLPIYAEGEKVEKVRIETAMGEGQKMFYITASGREIPVKKFGS